MSGEEGRPALIADDSDVAAIAVHVTRMVLDILTEPEQPVYPYAAYVLGLKRGWLFEQALDTYPVDVSSPGNGVDFTLALSRDRIRENVDFITDLIQRASCETSSSS